MSPHVIIDKYNLTISLLITIAWQIAGFIIAWTFKFDKVTDFTGGSNFFMLALITLLTSESYYTRNELATAFVLAWSARLAGFLLFRVLKTGSDTRFDDIRSHFWKFAGFWAGQILWVWVVSLPIVVLNSPGVTDRHYGGRYAQFGGTVTDIIGTVLFIVGFLWEAIADIQKYLYKASNPPSGKPCTKGLWYLSRHPPYFGEIVVHWGLFILCVGPTADEPDSISSGSKKAQYATVASPIFTMILLLFLSGLPTAEKPTAKKHFLNSHNPLPADTFTPAQPKNDGWQQYKDYLAKTSIILPIPPVLYRPIPEFIKRTVLLDFPMYRFDEAKDGRVALEEMRKRQGEA